MKNYKYCAETLKVGKTVHVKLIYSKGTIIIQGEVSTPYGQFDPRINAYRVQGYHYRDVLKYLENSKITYDDQVLDPPPAPPIEGEIQLYPYQQEALENWLKSEKRGVIVIATAGGKTFLGLKAIITTKEPTIIIVPTLVLVDHWVERLKEKLNIDAGVIGGGKKEIKYVTVTTYDSAYIYAEELGNKFSLIILDEAHHALAPNFALILEMFASPNRMGLTSTLHRPDMRHLDTPRLMGDVVYEATHEQLAGKYVAPFEYEKIFVDLTSEEKGVYEQQRKIYTDYLEKANLPLRTYEDFRRLIMRSGFDPEARAAVLARNLAFKIALNSAAKINFLAEQLKQVKEKTLIFTLHNDTVYQISKRFLVPAITHQTPEKERREILQKFKSGEYMAIVTSQVLDEGVDIPSASLGIILSGTGSPREYIQRLGRVLRKQEGKVAHLIEVVSRATSETNISLRRHRRLQDAAE